VRLSPSAWGAIALTAIGGALAGLGVPGWVWVVVLTVGLIALSLAIVGQVRSKHAGPGPQPQTTVIRTRGGRRTIARGNVGEGTDSVIDATDETDPLYEENVRLERPNAQQAGDADADS